MELGSTIVDSLSMPLLVVDRTGKVRQGNAAAGLFWRISPGRLAGYSVKRLFAADPRLMAAVERAMDSESSSTIDGLPVDQGEGQAPLLLRAQVDPVLVPGQPVQWALVVLWDETRKVQAESAAREAQLMESLGLIVRRLAHELQNPLSGVKGATQLLARRLNRSEEFSEFPGVILKELERLERLIKSMLSYGAEPPLVPTAFNLHALVDEVLWFVSNSEFDVELVRDYDPSLPDLRADRDRIHQVLLNLLRNAVESASEAPGAGRVRVRTEMQGPWNAKVALPDPNRTYFCVEVEDNGAGVRPKDRARLFTPFFTTKRSGTGLGLAISYQIVRAHEGALLFRPAAGNGAVFTMLLPMVERETAA